MSIRGFAAAFGVALASVFSAFAQPNAAGAAGAAGAWTQLEIMPANVQAAEPWIRPQAFKPFLLDDAAKRAALSTAPMEEFPIDRTRGLVIEIPHPDGGFAKFRIVETALMEAPLAAQFPDIKTYCGQGIDDPAATIRLDMTPQGFHGMVLSPNGDYYIDPYSRNDVNHYGVYYKRDFRRMPFHEFFCAADGEGQQTGNSYGERASGTTLSTFRLAVAATGEYTTFHGGTAALGQAAIVTAVNRCTGVYEKEVCVRFTLVANNINIVFTNNATDGYTNNNSGTMLGENQAKIDLVIGSANYDIGHVFSTGVGGIAQLGCVCSAGNKAKGVTGLPSPVGDPFYIDYVVHEMGHQFNAAHTFNSTTSSCGGGNRSASSAYEPGSGTTIMAYAGICDADDVQPHSDAMFIAQSYDQIRAFVTTSASCRVDTATGNTVPVFIPGASKTIPKGTAFTMTPTSASDANGDTLSFSWEERDLGIATTLAAADNGTSPIFRAFNPTTSRSRTFPAYSTVLNGVLLTGEKYPAVARTMVARLTVRDNRVGGGGVNSGNVTININGTAGPFQVTSPNTNVSWSGTQTVTWNVASTSIAPVSTANVKILLSLDGGNTFPTTLLATTPNTGSASVTLPGVSSTQARIRVEAVGNIYFDISNVNFTITGAPPPNTPTSVLATPSTVCSGATVTLSGTVGAGETIDWYTGSCGGTLVGSGLSLNVIPPVTATYHARARNTTTSAVSPLCATADVIVNTTPASAPTGAAASDSTSCNAVNVSWTALAGATSYQVFRNVTNDSASAALVGSPAASPYPDTTANPGTTYFFWVKAANACGAGPFSTSNAGTRSSPPPTPTLVAATDSTSCANITITWTNSAGATGYQIWRNTINDSASASLAGNASGTPFVDTPTAGITYFYWIRATNTCGASAFSTPDQGARSAVPDVPTSVAASDNASCAQVNISWSPSAGVVNYEVWRSTTNNSAAASLIASPAGPAYTDFPANAGTQYYYFIKSTNTCGQSAFSASDAGSRTAIPAAPSSLVASDGTSCDQVALSWSGVSGATSYAVLRNTINDSGSALVIAPAVVTTAFNDTSAVAAITHFYWIRAGNICGDSPVSVTDTGFRDGPPSAPASAEASDGASCTVVNVSWASAPGAASYTVLRNTINDSGTAVSIFAGAASPHADASAAPFTTYFYWVFATNTCGSGSLTSAGSGYTLGVVDVPTNVAAADGTSCDGVLVTWSLSPNADTYSVWRNTVNDAGTASLLASSPSTSYDDSTALPGVTYFYFVTASRTPCAASALSASDAGIRGDSAMIATQPTEQTVIAGDPASFTVVATGGGITTYQWRFNSLPLSEDPPHITGTQTDTLSIDAAQAADEGPYDVIVTNECGQATSDSAMLTVNSDAPCYADFNQDGGIDGADVDAFFVAWEAGDAIADVNQDGGVDGTDVAVFFAAWESGSC